MRDGKQICLIDVRSPAEFDSVHARGARLIPLDRISPAEIAAVRSGPTDPIYLICQAGSRSARACEKLSQAGIAQAFSIEGGTAAWEAAGLPVDRGPGRVISLERQVRIAAGSLVLIAVALTLAVHWAFIFLAAFVGAGLVFAGITDFCGMGLLLAKMPWNNRTAGCGARSQTPETPNII
jgi:rhodanese-related sulfurtransferase